MSVYNGVIRTILRMKAKLKLILKSLHETISGNPRKYDILNRAESWSEGMKKNGCPVINYVKGRTVQCDGPIPEAEFNEGGIIVFPVNANEPDIERITDWIGNQSGMTGRWAAGHYLDGNFHAPDGSEYSIDSLSIMIGDAASGRMVEIAEELCKGFGLKSVLLKDFSTGWIMYVNAGE